MIEISDDRPLVEIIDDVVVITILSGAPGPPGDRGLEGDIGPVGPPGPTGLRGEKGSTGAIGPRGYTGATGGIGSTGPKGDRGLTGPRGYTGADSTVPGPQGPRGLTGPPGEGSLVGVLDDLTDVTITTPQALDLLIYSDGEWVNANADTAGLVTIATAQTITGEKTFTNDVIIGQAGYSIELYYAEV